MDGAPQSYFDRLEAGIGFRWRELPARVFSAADVDPCASVVQLHREGRSYRGVGQRSSIRMLLAYNVDQAFLDEICDLGGLETLYMQGVRASDLSRIAQLGKLQRLVINGATRIDDLAWTREMPASLRCLAIEHAPRVSSLDPVAGLNQLTTLAVEGSLQANMKVDSLTPLTDLHGPHYLFLTALKTRDRRLHALAELRQLRVLEFANYYAAGEVEKLSMRLPKTRCSWFAKLDSRR